MNKAEKTVMSVFEHQRLTLQDFAHHSDFIWLMAQELPVFTIKRQRGQWQLKVSHYIGIILLPSNITLEILPKTVAKNSNKNQQSEPSNINDYNAVATEQIIQTRQWVEQMLSTLLTANDSNRSFPTLKNFGQIAANLTPLPLASLPLSQWLVEQFLQLLARCQPSKCYQAKVQNQTTLQGKLLIKEQLRRNNYQPHKFISEVSTLNTHMLSNRLIKSALQLVEPLLTRSVLPKSWLVWRTVIAFSRYEIRQLDSLYTSAKQQLSQQPLTRQQRQSTQQLLEFAYWLLKTQASTRTTGNGLSGQQGNQTSATTSLPTLRLCLLLNMNQAFEQWASLCIAKTFAEKSADYRHFYQSPHVWLKDSLNQTHLSMRPDLVIYKHEIIKQAATDELSKNGENIKQGNKAQSYHCSQVIDIKWKLLTNASDLSASDAYQLNSYAQAYQARQVWLVYPVTDDTQQPIALHRHLDKRFSAQTRVDTADYASIDRIETKLWLMPFNVLTGKLVEGYEN